MSALKKRLTELYDQRSEDPGVDRAFHEDPKHQLEAVGVDCGGIPEAVWENLKNNRHSYSKDNHVRELSIRYFADPNFREKCQNDPAWALTEMGMTAESLSEESLNKYQGGALGTMTITLPHNIQPHIVESFERMGVTVLRGDNLGGVVKANPENLKGPDAGVLGSIEGASEDNTFVTEDRVIGEDEGTAAKNPTDDASDMGDSAIGSEISGDEDV